VVLVLVMQNLFRERGIIYSCYTKVSRENESFIPEHIFTYIESGSMQVNDGNKVYSLKAGDFAFYVKNRLAKFIKQPAEDGAEYKSLSVLMDEQTLLKLKNSYRQVHNAPEPEAVIHLAPNVLYKSYAESLIAYLNTEEMPSEKLLDIKVQEIAVLLLENNPEFAGILFNFTEPGKIDIKEFMQRNFNFNVGLERFAYLTGRSLSTFKRDFEKVFGDSPSKWLQQKRLDEAYRLIVGERKKPSDVYIEVGFENLSHFSFAFKKAFGKSPSQFIEA